MAPAQVEENARAVRRGTPVLRRVPGQAGLPGVRTGSATAHRQRSWAVGRYDGRRATPPRPLDRQTGPQGRTARYAQPLRTRVPMPSLPGSEQPRRSSTPGSCTTHPGRSRRQADAAARLTRRRLVVAGIDADPHAASLRRRHAHGRPWRWRPAAGAVAGADDAADAAVDVAVVAGSPHARQPARPVGRTPAAAAAAAVPPPSPNAERGGAVDGSRKSMTPHQSFPFLSPMRTRWRVARGRAARPGFAGQRSSQIGVVEMARKANVLCAGGCGRLLWGGRGSLPAGKRTCRACRRLLTRPYGPRVERSGRNP